MMYAVYNAFGGSLVSTGTVVADPLPDGLEAIALSDADGEMLRTGAGRWDDATRSVVPLPPATPESVTPYQFRVWLIRSGVSLARVDAMIEALPQPARDEAYVAWEYGLEVRRDHPLVAQFGAALGLTTEQVDQGFREAASI